MCGITGILGNGDSAIVNSMSNNLSHRGPDGSGSFESDIVVGSVCLAQSRLAIVDVNGSKQPIGSEHKCVLVQNGEIYNFQKIRSEIPNYPWLTSGDSEAILALHRKYAFDNKKHYPAPIGQKVGSLFKTKDADKPGNKAEKHKSWVSRLDGVWGFALWVPQIRELILCRDPMGVKPLFRTLLPDGTLLFGSEVKSFYANPEFQAKPDINALAVRLAFEYPLDYTTLFSNVSSVAQGTIETWSIDKEGKAVLTGITRYNHEKISPDKHWNPNYDAEILLKSLYNGVESRLMSDVPVGVVLSGGLDSSLVAALSKQVSDSKGIQSPDVWTVAGDENNPDMKAAIQVAEHYDLNHHKKIIDPEKFWQTLPNFIWSGEDLDISVLFWQPLFEEMSKKVKVGICGQGADELHAGYSRYKELKKHSKLIDERLNEFGEISIEKEFIGLGQPWINSDFSAQKNFTSINDTLQFELDRGQLTNFQLRLGDRHSMAFGVEARIPFLSSEHRKLSHKIPVDWKISDVDEKLALRLAASLTDLPKEIVKRPKMPAGTATTPNIMNNLLSELTPHAQEWSEDYGQLSSMLKRQPDMSIGMRLFHAMHLTDNQNGIRKGSVMDLIYDVSDWNNL
ncbi:MAG: asparagine synthase (glutamine-hydrolyzing) [Candidatus Thalassarchaeaceae archaeon]|nr:asparagine synthase (glutamine-hydrolyzing) [Candidatus Thalassarchaeaceae archaeon]